MNGNGRVLSIGGKSNKRVKVEIKGRHWYRAIVEVPQREGKVTRVLGRLFRTASLVDLFVERCQPKINDVMMAKIAAEMERERTAERQAAVREKARGIVLEGAVLDELAKQLEVEADWEAVAGAVGHPAESLQSLVRDELKVRA